MCYCMVVCENNIVVYIAAHFLTTNFNLIEKGSRDECLCMFNECSDNTTTVDAWTSDLATLAGHWVEVADDSCVWLGQCCLQPIGYPHQLQRLLQSYFHRDILG